MIDSRAANARGVALVATLAIQIYASLAATAAAVLAPVIAQAFGDRDDAGSACSSGSSTPAR